MTTIIKNKRISALLPSFMADELKRTSKLEEKTQSEIINKALEDWFNKKLAKDAKFLAGIKFDDIPTEDEWLKIQPSISDLWK